MILSIRSESDISDLLNPKKWLVDWAAGKQTQAGESVSPENAVGLVEYFSAMRVIAEDVAKLPLVLYRQEGRAKHRATEEPLYRLLHDEPNPEMSSFTFRSTLQAWALGWHGGFAEIERTGSGRPLAMWPIHPSRVQVKRDPDTRAMFYNVKAADVGVEDVRLHPSNVLHIHGISPDAMQGYSLASIGAEAIGWGKAIERFGAKFFGRGLNPSGVLQHPETLGPEELANLRRSFQELYGRDGDGEQGLMVLEEGMSFLKLSIDPKVAQAIETRQFSVTQMARLFRLAPHKIQDLLRATFANIEWQAQEHVGDTLMPWFVRWEQEFNRKLLAPAQRATHYTKHVVEGLLRGDSAARSAFYERMLRNGIFTPNDVLELEDRNPFEGGDSHYLPRDLAVVQEDGTTMAADEGGGAEGAEPFGGDEAEPDESPEQTEAGAAIVAGLVSRFLAKEANAVKRMAAKCADARGFGAKLTEFYAGHERDLGDELALLAGSVAAMLGRGDEVVRRAVSYAAAHARRSRDEAMDGFKTDTITDVLAGWPNRAGDAGTLIVTGGGDADDSERQG